MRGGPDLLSRLTSQGLCQRGRGHRTTLLFALITKKSRLGNQSGTHPVFCAGLGGSTAAAPARVPRVCLIISFHLFPIFAQTTEPEKQSLWHVARATPAPQGGLHAFPPYASARLILPPVCIVQTAPPVTPALRTAAVRSPRVITSCCDSPS